MLMRSISSTSANATAQATARRLMIGASRSRVSGVEPLRVIDLANPRAGRQDDRGSRDRPGQRAHAGLVDARDPHDAALPTAQSRSAAWFAAAALRRGCPARRPRPPPGWRGPPPADRPPAPSDVAGKGAPHRRSAHATRASEAGGDPGDVAGVASAAVWQCEWKPRIRVAGWPGRHAPLANACRAAPAPDTCERRPAIR